MLQNNSELDVLIKRIGCLFLSLGRIIELETDTEFTVEQYNQIFFLSLYSLESTFLLSPKIFLNGFYVLYVLARE